MAIESFIIESVPYLIKGICIFLVLINCIGFIIMWVDKRRAIHYQWRIREATLLIIALLGGAIGVFLGMICFHHKTQKAKFCIGIPFIFLMQFLFVYYCGSLFN